MGLKRRQQKRQKIATTFVRLLAYLLAANCAVAQTGKLSADKQARIESTISSFMATSKAPGISAAVVQDGEFVWSAGFGMADLENSVPATSQTLYRLGSISKPITATAALALWEHGKLDLDSPVQKYCRHSRRSRGRSARGNFWDILAGSVVNCSEPRN